MLRSEEQQIRDGTAASQQSCDPTAVSRPEGRAIACSPQQLRLHPALDDLSWIGGIGELNEAARLTNQSVAEPILITACGIILTGFGRWRLAVLNRSHEINCIEYPLGDDEALQFIISHHQPRRGWNAFMRIRLALALEPYLQKRALENMRAGGKHKGLANLPKARHIDVRQEIANFAGSGACARNVGKVRTILRTAHPSLIEALTDGKLRINRAVQWCKLPRTEQLEQFTNYLWERTTRKVISKSIERSKKDESNLDSRSVLDDLQQLEVRQPGSVVVRCGRLQRTVILIGQDLLADPSSQRRLLLT